MLSEAPGRAHSVRCMLYRRWSGSGQQELSEVCACRTRAAGISGLTDWSGFMTMSSGLWRKRCVLCPVSPVGVGVCVAEQESDTGDT